MILPTDMTQPWCDMFKPIYFCSQAGRKIAHTPYLRLFQSSFNIEARSSCIFQDSGWIFALLHRVGCNSAVILHMFEGCEWLAGGTSREEGSGAHFCATLWSITTAGILLARRQHVQTDFSTQSLLPPVQSFLRVINWNSFLFWGEEIDSPCWAFFAATAQQDWSLESNVEDMLWSSPQMVLNLEQR